VMTMKAAVEGAVNDALRRRRRGARGEGDAALLLGVGGEGGDERRDQDRQAMGVHGAPHFARLKGRGQLG